MRGHFNSSSEGKLSHVQDADTIELATSRCVIAIRLNGVDAPELNEPGRRDGTDIGAAEIAAGHARDCARFSGGRYKKYEIKASRSIPSKPYCKRS